MKKYSILLTTLAVTCIMGLLACKKNNFAVDVDPLNVPSRAQFALYDVMPFAKTLNVQPVAPLDRISIPVGFTTVSNTDRTIQFTYTSTTGAQNGVHYNAPASVTIPAGEALDSLTIVGSFANLVPGATHNIKIKITGGDAPGFTGKDSLTLQLRQFCPVVTADLIGDYDNTNELFGTSAYGPYTTSVVSITPITATTATIVVSNIYDYGWNPISFVMDYSSPDPGLWTIAVVPTDSGIGDAGTLNSAYAGMDVAVRPFAGATGTWDQCTQKLILRFQIGVSNGGTILGWFANMYQLTMER